MALRDTSLRELQRVIGGLERELASLRAQVAEITVPDERLGWTKQSMDDAGYNDLVVSPATFRNVGATKPTEVTWLTNLKKWSFAINDYVYFEGMQLPHSYMPGTDLYPHVHFAPVGAIADTETVVFTITYTVASVWSVFPATEDITATFTNNAEARAKLPADSLSGTSIVANAHLIAGGATISGVTGNGIGLSAIIDGKLARASGTHAGAVILSSADSHIRLNRLGSRQEYTG